LEGSGAGIEGGKDTELGKRSSFTCWVCVAGETAGMSRVGWGPGGSRRNSEKLRGPGEALAAMGVRWHAVPGARRNQHGMALPFLESGE